MESFSYKTNLIGRNTEVKFLKDKLQDVNLHLLQVHGQPCVGKSKLVWEALRIIKHERKDESFYCKSITVKENDSWAKIESNILHFRNQYPIPARVLVILKDFHLFSPEILLKFQEFCCQMSLEGKMSVIIIHQRIPEFEIQGLVSEVLLVPPLDEDCSKMLFSRHAFNTDSYHTTKSDDEHIDYLIEQCSGLPGLLINLANKWREWSSFTSLAEFCDYFRKNGNVFQFMKDVVCPQLDISKSFNHFFKYLPETLKKALVELAVFPGPLSINEMTYMIEESNESKTKFEVALPLVMHGFLKKNKEKFKVKPLIRDVASQQLFHLYNEDVNRLKFVHLIGNVLLKAEEIYRKNMPMQTVGIVKDNWDNIEFLLRKGIHLKTDGETISVLFQVATEAGDVISACCPREAKEFFGDCLDAAEKVGTTEQRAMMQVRYGQSLTNEGGAGGEKDGMLQYQKAIDALKREGKDFRTLCLLNSMAYNYYRQGSLQNACKCAKEALEMEVKDEDPEVANHVKINSASIYAYTLIYLGHNKKAKEFLLETLENVGDPNHPSVSVILNSLGLAEEGPNGSESEALRWYTRSLSLRRKMSVIKPENLVIPLCHIADLASKTPQKYDLALKYLEEATEIMKKKCWIHIHSANIQYTYGIVYLRMKSLKKALHYFEDALHIHKQLHANHYFNATILNWISHCYLLKDEIALAAEKFGETKEMMAKLIDMRPNACYLAQPLEHLLRMNYASKKKLVSYQNELINELQRLVDFPDLDKTLVSNYENILDVYTDCKNSKKCILDKLPMTCTVCTEIKEYKICPLLQYKVKVNMVSYAEKLIPQRQPISNPNKNHRPAQIKFFSGAPRPPDPDPVPVPESPSASTDDEFISHSKALTISEGFSMYKESLSDCKDSDPKKLVNATSSDYMMRSTVENRIYNKPFWSRSPLKSVEHCEESPSMTIPKVLLDDNSRMGQSGNNLISKTNGNAKITHTGITDIITTDQSREYKSITSQLNSNLKHRNFCSPHCPLDENQNSNSYSCNTRNMSSISSGSPTSNFRANPYNKVTGINPLSRCNMLSSGHFGNPGIKMNQALNTPNDFIDVKHTRSHQNMDGMNSRYCMGMTTDQNSYDFCHGVTRRTNQTMKEHERLSHHRSSMNFPLVPTNTQNKTTRDGLNIAHQNDPRKTRNNLSVTFEQNSLSQNFNLPNFENLFADLTDNNEANNMNFADVDEKTF